MKTSLIIHKFLYGFNINLQEHFSLKLFFCTALLVLTMSSVAQNNRDSINTNTTDSLASDNTIPNDTIKADSTENQQQRTFNLESKIEYLAYDSIYMALQNRKAFLFGNYKMAEIDYQNINLKAGYIEIDFNKNELYAHGFKDSTGEIINEPVFKEGNKTYKSEELRYNFDTKKGLITSVITEEGPGYLHGERVKKDKDNNAWIKSGKYTTCNKDTPHYQIEFKKARVIPNDKIVMGPANLIIEGIPTPLWLPFGIFPNKEERANGLIMPSVGESANRGFFLKNAGYYWGFSEYMDLAIRGDIYSRGSWALDISSNYMKRYKYSGSLSLEYSVNKFGDKGSPDYREEKEFFIRWNHKQSPKARPNSSFSANVNAGSMEHNKFNPKNANSFLSNTFTSSINYNTLIGKKLNLSANFWHNQNTITKEVDLRLPEISFSVQRFHPFRTDKGTGSKKWYENISMRYTLNAENEISTTDSMLFKSKFSDFRNGVKHTIPIKSNIKLFNHLNFTNALNVNGYWYLNSIRQQWDNSTAVINGDTLDGYVRTDTIREFTQGYDFRYSSGINTKLYGMFNFRRGPVKALRHVLSPSVKFNYRPDFSAPEFGYYKHYLDGNSRSPIKYSIFQNGLYGGPPQGESGQIAFNVQNNLEMKVKNKKDTADNLKKVVLLKSLRLNMNYDMARDSLNWSPLSIRGYTTLMDEIDIRFTGTWDLYATDNKGNTIDVLEWNKNGRLFRRQRNEWSFDISYKLQSGDFEDDGKQKNKKKENNSTPGSKVKNNDQQPPSENQNPALNNDINFNKKWDLSFHYTMRYTNNYIASQKDFEYETVQTLSFNANINLTDKWEIGVNSGWDFEKNELSYTSVNIYRDLHCWEMMFNWIPKGFMKSYNLTIRVKAPALHDLKVTKQKSHLDYY